MADNKLPLIELSIQDLYHSSQSIVYEVPIYQRNYAWGKDEINALVRDVYDAYKSGKDKYYIGTLVSYNQGDDVYEVIDGQQRLTTIYLLLKALDYQPSNKLTYRARKKSDDTIQSIPDFKTDNKDQGIINGYNFTEEAINATVDIEEVDKFRAYFLDQVRIIHYKVPKDIDLNHYFEIMNSRGEQLEKHEIIKARLIEKLNDSDREKFNRLWENCSEMNVYIQQKYLDSNIFGNNHDSLIIDTFDELPDIDTGYEKQKIKDLLEGNYSPLKSTQKEKLESFQPIIDFSNFLLIVLKLTRMEEEDFSPSSFTLDDKELINEFDKIKEQIDEQFVKKFGYNLLLAKYNLDNYIVHHAEGDETYGDNPWKLQYWQKSGKNRYLVNLDGESDYQLKLVHLLSMFEVTFTARQRKNYLFYCLKFLKDYGEDPKIEDYYKFVSNLAEKIFKDVYLVEGNLNSINTPSPGSFDTTVLKNGKLNLDITNTENTALIFEKIYGNGSEVSNGIPLYIFNYMDYKLWEKYCNELRGEKLSEVRRGRIDFFENIGCSDFGQDIFDQFYFSRTRRSLEHYFPSANINNGSNTPSLEQINCFGNYAMIGSDINSSGSNWSPKTKLEHYQDTSSRKIKLVSVASLKFIIMMQKCRDNSNNKRNYEECWVFTDIKEHQEKMLALLN